MKIKRWLFALFILFVLFISFGISSYALETGFSYTEITQEKQETFIQNIKLQLVHKHQ